MGLTSKALAKLTWICLVGPWLWAAALPAPAAGSHPSQQASRGVRSAASQGPKPLKSAPPVQIADTKLPGSQLEELHQPSVLLVTLLDGSIVGVDSNSGSRLWAYDSGAPLVSVNQADGAAGGINIFPGIDGALYAYHGLEEGKAQLERLPMSLPELVSSSPSLAVDGSVVLGTRVSTVFALHRQSGQLIRLLSGVAGALSADTGVEGVQLPTQFDPSSMVLVGREDFIVRSMQAHTGQETWNATFARVMQLHPLSHQRMHSDTQPLGGPSSPRHTRLGGMAGIRLAMAADNALQAYDARTGMRRWSIKFDAPPIAAFDTSLGSDGRNQLEPSPPSKAAPLQAPPSQHAAPVAGQHVMVGVLRGSLYAIPTDMIACVPGFGPFTPNFLPGSPSYPSSSSGVPALPASPAPQPQLPNQSGSPKPLPDVWRPGQGPTSPAPPTSSSGAGDEDDGPSTALSVVVPDPTALSIMSHTPDEDTAPMVSSLVCPLGVHALAGSYTDRYATCSSLPQVPWLPPLANTTNTTSESTGRGRTLLSRWQHSLGLIAAALLTLVCLLVARQWLLVGTAGQRGVTATNTPQDLQQASSNPAVQLQAGADGGGWSGMVLPDAKPGQLMRDGSEAVGLDSPRKLAASTNASNHSTKSSSGGGRVGGKQAGNGKHGKSGPGAQQHRQDGSNNSSGGNSQAGRATGAARHEGRQSRASESDSEDDDGNADQHAGAEAHSKGEAGLQQLLHSQQQQQQQHSASNHSASSQQLSQAGSDPAALTRLAQLQPDGSFVMGRLRVGPGILGYGSAGTIVYEGWMDGRPVAVKRLLRQFYDMARKEIDVLIVSDEHPNVVRCFAMEEDREFVYLALERCRSTLADALAAPQAKGVFLDGSGSGPSQRCVDVMQQVVQGLSALHERGIVHRDLKPHNVLLTDAGRVKLSDMGLSRQLVAEQSSFESHGAGGSSGWQAPEQLIARGGGAARQTRSMDVFSLGCVLYYCCTAGKHPFGETFERDAAILRGHPNLAPLANVPEALNLVSSMLAKDADARPTMQAVCGHPMWWSSEQRLQFLVDISDRVENEDREPDQRLLSALEAHAAAALQPAGPSYSITPNWGGAVEPELVANLGRYRRYDYTSLRDLLRVVRNKRNHFREMPSNLQALVGPLPHGFLRYFTSRFPNLLMAGWVFALRHLREEQHLGHYWPGGAQLYERFVLTFLRTHPQRQQPSPGPAQQQAYASLQAPLPPTPPKPLSNNSLPPTPELPPLRHHSGNGTSGGGGLLSPAWSPAASKGGAASTGAASPLPAPGSEAGSMGGANTSSAGAQDAAGNHTLHSTAPPTPPAPPMRAALPVVVGYEVDPDAARVDGGVGGGLGTYVREFPRRPGKQVCDFYSKTGHCKFGDNCVFDHPDSLSVRLTALGLPLRPDMPICAFYTKNNECKFGAACKFHHPVLRPVLAGQSLPANAAAASATASVVVGVVAAHAQVVVSSTAHDQAEAVVNGAAAVGASQQHSQALVTS